MELLSLLTRLDDRAKDILDGDVDIIKYSRIPRDGKEIYVEAQKWIRINNICAVFIDMVRSSQIDFSSHTKTSARIYETFTGSMVRIMQAFDAAYIDIQGDGLLALFDGEKAYAKGFIAATTFRKFAKDNLSPRVLQRTSKRVDIKTRAGLSYGDIIVKRVGTRSENKQVWAYQRVNQAAKLASIAQENCIVVSKRAYENELQKIEWINNSCGCINGEPTDIHKCLWTCIEDEERLKPPVVDKAYETSAVWCDIHGEEYINKISEYCEFEFPKLKSIKAMFDDEY